MAEPRDNHSVNAADAEVLTPNLLMGTAEAAQRVDDTDSDEGDDMPRPSNKKGITNRDKKETAVLLGGFADNQTQLDRVLRQCFIRKVYGILSLQLMVTVGICSAMMFVDSVRDFALANFHIIWIPAFIGSIILLCALQAYRAVSPHNIILLFVFTVLWSTILGSICAAYYEMGLGANIGVALAITLAVFLGLTLFSFQTKYDTAGMGGFLMGGLWVMITWSFINYFFGAGSTNHFVFALLGALLFCGFIVYDTQNIIKRCSYDDAFIAAVELYLDIINLFLYILMLLRGGRN